MSPAPGQVNIQGKVRLKGVSEAFGGSGYAQYTHIWAFAPPNTSGGTGFNDNYNFIHNLMNNSAVPIDGVSILEAWNQIETAPPTSTPCAPSSDTCQPDPAIIGMYHNYSWATYDNTTGGSTPVYQWLALSGKKVNILISGADSAAANPTTPHYVTSPAWFDLFNPQQQDVINALKDCSTGLPWTGTGATATSSGGTVTVNTSATCCVSPPQTPSPQTNLIQDQDLVWVNTTTTNCGTGAGGQYVNVTGTNQFTYTASSCTTTPLSSPTYISAAQSWAVPYEYPYKAALKAFWAAVVAHYGPGFSLPAVGGTNYFPQLNYFRFGGSVGSEWFPYCVSGTNSASMAVGLTTLSSPYTYGKLEGTGGCAAGSCTGWLNYYQEMGNYLQSINPPFRVIHSINTVLTAPGMTDPTYGDAEAAYAVTWSNRFGARDGFGSQGLSAADNATSSASDWYPTFQLYGPSGTSSSGGPLELQTIALSDPTDDTCSPIGCAPASTSADLRIFLPFAVTSGVTDVELYWRDLSLAYDWGDYCYIVGGTCGSITGHDSVSPGGWLTSPGQQFIFFSNTAVQPGVGQGPPSTDCTGSYQSGSHGNCQYANQINLAHGPH